MKIRLYISILAWLILATMAGVSSAANPQVTLQISGGATGQIVLEIYGNDAPVTAVNFIDYVKSGFYNSLIFHRVMSGFMVQGGGYDVDLVPESAGPEIINESTNGLSNLRGTVAMARTPYPHSATSEFFINVVDNLFLDYGAIAYNGSTAYYLAGYCVFGRVISGMDVVDAIAAVTTNAEDVPLNPIFIQSATVTLDEPVCIDKPEGDIDGNCTVDFRDFIKIANNWLESTYP